MAAAAGKFVSVSVCGAPTDSLHQLREFRVGMRARAAPYRCDVRVPRRSNFNLNAREMPSRWEPGMPAVLA